MRLTGSDEDEATPIDRTKESDSALFRADLTITPLDRSSLPEAEVDVAQSKEMLSGSGVGRGGGSRFCTWTTPPPEFNPDLDMVTTMEEEVESELIPEMLLPVTLLKAEDWAEGSASGVNPPGSILMTVL